jgi:prephenate dehydrogenase
MKKITIIGLGMMGASFALALKRAGLAQSVCGVARRSAALEEALQKGIIDCGTTNIGVGVRDAEMVVIATPVCAVMNLLPMLSELKYSGVIIDLGSTKQAICEIAETFPQLRFVGCHPMAGSEIPGLIGANAALFDGAPVIITPADNVDPALLERVTGLWEALGCRISFMNPEKHDFSVAVISHLPYLASVITMNTAAELAQDDPGIFSLIAGGFRDTTRISEGDPVMWRDICLTNRSHILTAIEQFKTCLNDVEQALKVQDANLLQNIFQTSQQRRKTYIQRKKCIMP